ncbi:hypothetical protein BGC33_01605 [Bathymodiolus thermophilus thioautotrophic gill symbiont]|uniref:Uncharacterized protein n=2 Tax=Bathymodiolus thermophilus thioautotrophic gill symbiont TaxID=2360 RepID=A0A1J5TSD0_9GAMM|nr:hypothetical protein BGC33_01605 [Bathymodiolus thermophilus thioautotrophic gill symbiont]
MANFRDTRFDLFFYNKQTLAPPRRKAVNSLPIFTHSFANMDNLLDAVPQISVLKIKVRYSPCD